MSNPGSGQGSQYFRFDNSPAAGAAGVVAGSWTVPFGINGFRARLFSGGGGGGGGGGSVNGQAGGAGGAAGAIVDLWIPVTGPAAIVTPGTVLFIVLRGGGTGGAGGNAATGVAGNPGGDCGINRNNAVEVLPGGYIAYAVGGMGGKTSTANSATIVNGGSFGWANNSNVGWPGCGAFSAAQSPTVGGMPVLGGSGGGAAGAALGGGGGGAPQWPLLVSGAAGATAASANANGVAGQAATYPGCGGGGGGGGSVGGTGGAGGNAAGSMIEIFV